MEHQTINAYGNGYVKSPLGYDWLLHHELSHEWFGNQMTNADWDDMWLHEGFGSYMQPLYMESLRGEMEFQACCSTSASAAEQGAHRQRQEPAHRRHLPGRTRWPRPRHLRQGRADPAHAAQPDRRRTFFTATRRMVYGTATPAPGNFQPRWSSTKEFIQFANEASGRDLQWFFDAYLYHAALPELVEERSADKLKLTLEAERRRRFPLPSKCASTTASNNWRWPMATVNCRCRRTRW
jgi:aminopeptidase N